MKAAIEIHKPLVDAFRMSEALPNTQESGTGSLHILYGDHFRPVGYLVEKVDVEDAWNGTEARYFVTTSHAEALALLATPARELSSESEAVV